MKFPLPLALLCAHARAFAPTTIPPPRPLSPLPQSSTRLLAASGGPPQYDKVDATLREAVRVSDDGSSVLLRIEATEEAEGELEYEPGHVLALEIQPAADDEDGDKGDDGDEEVESKARRDARENGGWMRGPYTVSRSTPDSLDVLIKVVGEKSRRFADAPPGTPVRFGGRFHVPILEGIGADATDRVVLVSTGVGVGPCVGAIEGALEEEAEGTFPPIDLIASFRTEAEVACGDLLDELQEKHAGRFSWKAIITGERGRLSSSDDNLKELTDTTFDAPMGRTHYHLIGNGQMVSEFKQGLSKAGVAEDKITVESYFNHRAEVDSAAVDRIAAAVAETAAAGVA